MTLCCDKTKFKWLICIHKFIYLKNQEGSNFFSLSVNILTCVFYVPYLIDHLVFSLFGFLPLALLINQLISVISGSHTGALTRFYAISIADHYFLAASRYLFASLFILIGVCIFIKITLISVMYNIDSFYNIPARYVLSAKWLFTLTIMLLCVFLCSNTIAITFYAKNRLELTNILKILRQSLRFGFLILFFTYWKPSITNIGVVLLFTEAVVLLCSFVFYYLLRDKEVELNRRFFAENAPRFVLVMSFWVIVQQLGDLGLYKLAALIVNVYWNELESGYLAAIFQLIKYAFLMVTVISTLFGLLMLIVYLNDKVNEVVSLILSTSLVVGVFSSIGAGLLFRFSRFIIDKWLSVRAEVSIYLSLRVKAFLIPYDAAANVFAFVSRAWNKVRIPAIATLVLGVMNALLLFFLAIFLGNDLINIKWILFNTLIFVVLQSYLLNSVYFSFLYKGQWSTVIVNFVIIVMILFFTCFVSDFIWSKTMQMLLYTRVLSICALAVSIIMFVYFRVLNKTQRSYII